MNLNAPTETKEWRNILSHGSYAHAEFETLMRSNRIWISNTVDFHICNILHVAISEELIAHNTATKWLHIISSPGSSQIRDWTPQRAYRSNYDIWWTLTLVTSFMSHLRRNASFMMTRNINSDYFIRTVFENSLVLLSRVNNALCVYLCLYNHLFDDSSSNELDAHTETLRDIPCRVIIRHTWINLWLANHTLLWGPTKYLIEKIQFLLQITRTITHSRGRSSNAAQSRANAHTTPCVWGPVY